MLKEKESLLKTVKLPRRNVHKNTLLAFGAVSLNKKEVEELERDLVANEKGFTKCQGLIRSDNKLFERGIKEKYCENRALRVMQLDPSRKAHRDALKESRDSAKKKFAPLAKNVSRITLAGMDYLGAALAQMTGTIVKMPSAINNARNEFNRLHPYEVAMMVSRLENIKRIAPYFPQYMSDHISIYKTLYTVLRNEYPDEVEGDGKKMSRQVWERVLAVEVAYASIKEKIDALSRGEEVNFAADEGEKWDRLAALFPSEYQYPDGIRPNHQMIVLSLKTQTDFWKNR
jgi:hypothetical protein